MIVVTHVMAKCIFSSTEYSGIVDTRILNIERDGGVLYSWKVSGHWARGIHIAL
jgi:hypothetical protein